MNASDLARLEVAKRAYRATEPSAAEVQRGVRKARLGLQRPKTRSTWLTKTAVALVLAMGGLAYAKPHALGQLVPTSLEAQRGAAKQNINGGLPVASAAPAPVATAKAEPQLAANEPQASAAVIAAPRAPVVGRRLASRGVAANGVERLAGPSR